MNARTTGSEAPSVGGGRPLWAGRSLPLLGGGIVLLVVASVVIVLVAGDRTPRSLPVGSPEHVVQEYLAAFEDGDYDAAYQFFSSRVRDEVSPSAYEDSIRAYGYGPGMPFGGGSRRVLFDRSTLDGERARVHLTVEEFHGGGLFGGGDTYRWTRDVRLVREDGNWRIDEVLVWLETVHPEFEGG